MALTEGAWVEINKDGSATIFAFTGGKGNKVEIAEMDKKTFEMAFLAGGGNFKGK